MYLLFALLHFHLHHLVTDVNQQTCMVFALLHFHSHLVTDVDPHQLKELFARTMAFSRLNGHILCLSLVCGCNVSMRMRVSV